MILAKVWTVLFLYSLVLLWVVCPPLAWPISQAPPLALAQFPLRPPSPASSRATPPPPGHKVTTLWVRTRPKGSPCLLPLWWHLWPSPHWSGGGRRRAIGQPGHQLMRERVRGAGDFNASSPPAAGQAPLNSYRRSSKDTVTKELWNHSCAEDHVRIGWNLKWNLQTCTVASCAALGDPVRCSSKQLELQYEQWTVKVGAVVGRGEEGAGGMMKKRWPGHP